MECMHPTHAPARRIWTTPSVTSRSSMSPPSPWMYGRMVSRTCSTRSRRPPSCVCTCSAISALLSLCRLRMRRGVITRLSLARVMTRPERMPAPAGRNGVGVADREAFAKRRFRIVDLCPAQVLEAAGVHEHLHAAALEDLVVGAALGIESHTVREPFAPTGLNEQPQVQARLLLGLEQLLQLRRRLIGDGNHSGKPSTCHSRGYATLSQTTRSRRLLRGCAPRYDNMGLGSRIPYPGSHIFRYAHDLSNLRITQQIVDLLCREGLRRIAVGVDRAQEAERFGAGVHELMRDIRGNVHKIKRRHVEHLAADHHPAGAAEDDDGMNVTVLLQTRISARFDLKVPELKRHRLARTPGQDMACHVLPCGTRCPGPAESATPRAHPIPRLAVELAMPPVVRRAPPR